MALLRGINVGGHNKLPMADLRACLEDAGFEDVKTYIQSGNVALTAPACDPEQLNGLIKDRFNLDVPVIVRTADQLAAAIEQNPFPEAETEPKFLMVYFCSAPFNGALVAEFDHDRYAPDRLAVAANAVGNSSEELYVAYSEGLSNSKLANPVLERAFAVSTTARNWNTVLKLQAMANG